MCASTPVWKFPVGWYHPRGAQQCHRDEGMQLLRDFICLSKGHSTLTNPLAGRS